MLLQRLFHVLALLSFGFRAIHCIHERAPLRRYEAGRVEAVLEDGHATRHAVETNRSGSDSAWWGWPSTQSWLPFANNPFATSAKDTLRQNSPINWAPSETSRIIQDNVGRIGKMIGLPDNVPQADVATSLGDGSLAGTRAVARRHFDSMQKSTGVAEIIDYADSVMDPNGGKKLQDADPTQPLRDIKRLGDGLGANKVVNELDTLIKNSGLKQMGQIIMMFSRLFAGSGMPAASFEFLHKFQKMYGNNNRPSNEEVSHLVNETNARLGLTPAAFSNPFPHTAHMDNPFSMDDFSQMYTITRPMAVVNFDLPCESSNPLCLRMTFFAEAIIKGPGEFDSVMGPTDGSGRINAAMVLWVIADGLRFAYVWQGIGKIKGGMELFLAQDYGRFVQDQFRISGRIRIRSSLLPVAREITMDDVEPARRMTLQPMHFIEVNTLQDKPLIGIDFFLFLKYGMYQIAFFQTPAFYNASSGDLDLISPRIWTGFYSLSWPWLMPNPNPPPLPPLPPLQMKPVQEKPVPHVITELPPEWAGVFNDQPVIPTSDTSAVTATAKGLRTRGAPSVSQIT